jgi:hypothetical protein
MATTVSATIASATAISSATISGSPAAISGATLTTTAVAAAMATAAISGTARIGALTATATLASVTARGAQLAMRAPGHDAVHLILARGVFGNRLIFIVILGQDLVVLFRPGVCMRCEHRMRRCHKDGHRHCRCKSLSEGFVCHCYAFSDHLSCSHAHTLCF